MGASILIVVLAFSSLNVSFPWYVWLIGLMDILVMISNDHKLFLREQQLTIISDIKFLEEHRGKLINECLNLEKSREEHSKNQN